MDGGDLGRVGGGRGGASSSGGGSGEQRRTRLQPGGRLSYWAGKKEGEVRRGQERGEGQVVMNVLLFTARLSAGAAAGAVTLGHL